MLGPACRQVHVTLLVVVNRTPFKNCKKLKNNDNNIFFLMRQCTSSRALKFAAFTLGIKTLREHLVVKL